MYPTEGAKPRCTGATLNLVDLSTDLLDAAGVFMVSGGVTGLPMGFTYFFFRLTGFACFPWYPVLPSPPRKKPSSHDLLYKSERTRRFNSHVKYE